MERAEARMGMKISSRELIDIRTRILFRDGEQAWFSKAGQRRTEKWIVEYYGRLWHVVFDRDKNWIVSVLDPPSDEIIAAVLRRRNRTEPRRTS